MNAHRLSSMRRPIEWSIAVFFLTLSSSQAATLTASYGATLSNSVSCSGYGANQSSSSAASVTSNGPCFGSNGSLNGAAVALPGHLGALAASTGGGSTGSSAIFDGFVIFSPTNPSTAASVSTALNLSVNGLMLSLGDMTQGQFSDAIFGVQVTLNSNFFLYREQIFNQRASVLDPRNSLVVSPGGRTSSAGSALYGGLLSTPTVQVPLGIPVFLTIRLDILAEGFSTNNNFLSSLDLPVDADVFTLPAGFTANSADMNLVNNHFGASTTAAPEPAPLGLLFLGCVGLAVTRSRARRYV